MASVKCPTCGVRLLHKGLSHACGPHTVAAFLAGRTPRGRALFRRFDALVRRLRGVSRAPAKTRVAYVADVRFASVNAVRGDAIDVHLVLPRRLASPRFRRVEAIGKLFVHHLRLTADADFDAELAGWVRGAHREYGCRGRPSGAGDTRARGGLRR